MPESDYRTYSSHISTLLNTHENRLLIYTQFVNYIGDIVLLHTRYTTLSFVAACSVLLTIPVKVLLLSCIILMKTIVMS